MFITMTLQLEALRLTTINRILVPI